MAVKKRSSSTDSNRRSPSVSIKYEAVLWGVLAFSIILFISNFGIAGKAGNFISSIFFGLFGMIAYIFPIMLFAGTAFMIANRNNTIAMIKVSASIVFVLFTCMFLELIGGDSMGKSPLASYLWSVEHKYGGGLIGGLLTWLIRSTLGTISAYVIDIIVMIICMILITERSLWKKIQSGGKKVYTSAKNETIRQREQQPQRRQRRIDNKVTGVSMDISIKDNAKPGQSDAINEIRPDPAFTQDFPIHLMGQQEPHTTAEMEEMPKQAAVGMDFQDGTPTTMYKSDADYLNNVIPITSQKVALKPNQPEKPLEQALEKEQEMKTEKKVSPAIERAEDILAKTSELFSEMLPDIGSMETQQDITRPTPLEQAETDPAETSVDHGAISDINNLAQTLFDGIEIIPGEMQTGPDEGYTTSSAAPDTQKMHNSSKVSNLQTVSNLDGNSEASVDSFCNELSDMHTDTTTPLTADELIAQQLHTAAAPADADMPKSTARSTHAITPVGHSNPKQTKAEAAAGAADTAVQIQQAQPPVKRRHVFPEIGLLKRGDPNQTGDSRQHLQETALKLQQTLKNFGVNVTILNVSCGPAVTRYEIQPEMGVKVSKIVNLADDIKLNLAAADIRIEAPIPGKAAIGIEVPNKENVTVMFRDLIEAEEFQKHRSPCAFAVGKDIAGQVVVTDICKMPHLLIAGATGAGKSVCINTIIMSIIYKADPEDVKLIMIDPKVVELSVYNGIPHLLLPVVTDPKKAAGSLHWAVSEMMDRYQKFANYGVRDIKGYNEKIKQIENIADDNKPEKMPYIVIIVDELADLMMVAPGDVEDAICRLAQLARAAGIHLIIATQRPSVNVITGLIKANMPSRIAFSVTSGIDSRTILDMNGAEKLLGKGDMLFYPQGLQKPIRVQGAFVSDPEVSRVVEFLTEQNGVSSYNSALEEKVASAAAGSADGAGSSQEDSRDVYFADAAKLLMDKEKASVSMLQRFFKIGFNRAARIMDQLEEAGVVGPEEGTKPRKILMTPEQFAQYEEEVL